MAKVTAISASLSKEAVVQFLSTCTYEEFLELLFSYFEIKGIGGTNTKKTSSMVVLQQKMLAENIHNACPHCGSASFVKCGTKPNGLTCFKCKACGRKFNVFTGTVLESTHWQWELWVKVLEMTINDYSVRDIVNVLVRDYGCTGIDHKTVWQWQLKLIHALASIPTPTLTGVIEIDETFPRECQKGSRCLKNYLPEKFMARLPRYGYQPSILGIMGPEFCTVVTAIDSRGYCVCKVLCMGKLDVELFYDSFDSHIENPTYICTDGNPLYESYCEAKNYKHYIIPSTYSKILDENGYVTPTQHTGPLTNDEKRQNLKIKKSLYRQGEIDKLSPGCYTYEEFEDRKNENGLSLGKVDALHKEIKKFINVERTNVSSKYLQDYIGFFTYIHNWQVEHGHKPSANADAMEIPMDILKLHCNRTKSDIKRTVLSLPKPTGKYVCMLKKKTEEARKATQNKYFKFNAEDAAYSFDKRTFLLGQQRTKLHTICRNNGLRGYSNWTKHSIVSYILKLPDAEDIITRLLTEKRHSEIEDEDKERQ